MLQATSPLDFLLTAHGQSEAGLSPHAMPLDICLGAAKATQ
jgi:hypothetical protein